MEAETKYRFGEIRKVDDNVEETRTVEFVISTEAKDRHGTVLNMKNWNLDNFNRNGIVGYQHNVYGDSFCLAPNPDDVIGIGKAFFRGADLIGSVKFEPPEINPLAEKVFRKVLHGTLRATSVGFMPILNEKGQEGQYGRKNEKGDLIDKDTFYFHGQELLEFSIVNIPSNPEALKKAVRGQSANALAYVHRALGGKLRFSEIEKLNVREILDMIEGKEVEPEFKKVLAELEEQRQQMGNKDLLINNLKAEKEFLQKTVRYYKNKSLRG